MTAGEEGSLPRDVPSEVKALIEVAERQGWTRQVVQEKRQRARYWCPCEGHEVWIEFYPKTMDYVDRMTIHLQHTTCWEEEQ